MAIRLSMTYVNPYVSKVSFGNTCNLMMGGKSISTEITIPSPSIRGLGILYHRNDKVQLRVRIVQQPQHHLGL
jgi:hypothetical protein